jgi:hypothetical protein
MCLWWRWIFFEGGMTNSNYPHGGTHPWAGNKFHRTRLAARRPSHGSWIIFGNPSLVAMPFVPSRDREWTPTQTFPPSPWVRNDIPSHVPTASPRLALADCLIYDCGCFFLFCCVLLSFPPCFVVVVVVCLLLSYCDVSGKCVGM